MMGHICLSALWPLFAAVSLATSAHAFAPGDHVGATTGTFKVADDGTATYTIPIRLPPGSQAYRKQLSHKSHTTMMNKRAGIRTYAYGRTLHALSHTAQTLKSQVRSHTQHASRHSRRRLYLISRGAGVRAARMRADRAPEGAEAVWYNTTRGVESRH
jgi:hypothetical protein